MVLILEILQGADEFSSVGGKVMAYGSGRPSSSQLEGAVGEAHWGQDIGE